MGYDQQRATPPAGLSDQQRQMLDMMRGVAESLRDDCDFLVDVLALLATASAPTPQLLDLARRAAFRLVRAAATAEGAGRGIWNTLAVAQQGGAPLAPQEPPVPAAPSEQTPTPLPTDAPAADPGAALYQRRGVS